ncbi:hypothetical protein [Streptomyces sp. NPDC046939]|uniref:hypothetical protein n=1 Tax=Streptomyces sp. NPDC046939 TaxID=3155376 RepID=UPI0033E862C5
MTDHPTTQGALLLVGGQAARLLRQRHAGLPLLIGGRRPERAEKPAASSKAAPHD